MQLSEKQQSEMQKKFKHHYNCQTLTELRKMKKGLIKWLRENPTEEKTIRYMMLEQAIAEKSKAFGNYS